jgi:tetratricopeptide (TPR) repeat protein
MEDIEKIEKLSRKLIKIMKTCDYEKALKRVNKPLKDYPNATYFIQIKSIALYELGKYEELLKFHEGYSKDIYENINLVYAKLNALNKLGYIKEEISFINESLNYFPGNFSLVNRNYDILPKFQDVEDIKFLKELLKVNPNNTDIYYNLGCISNNYGKFLKDNSKYEDAMSYFNKIIELYDNDDLYDEIPSGCYINKAETYMNLKKYDDALKTLDLIDNNDMNTEIKFRTKAIIYRKMKDYDNALKFIDKAIEEDKDNDSYLIEIKGTIYLCMKEYDTAINYFNQIIDDEYTDSTMYYKAFALKEKGEYLKSLKYLKKFKKSEYMIKRGWVDYQYEKAQKLIKEINSLNK